MGKKAIEYFFLTSKEEDSMKVLWAADRPLSAAEIAEGIPNRKWPATSIHGILKNLEKKQAVKVAEITRLGKSYGRLFVPTLSINEYAAMQFERYYQSDGSNDLPLVSALLGGNENKTDLINTLQQLIDQYKEG